MTKKAIEIIDPTLAATEITIAGNTYKMCLNFRALAQAESELVAQGHDVNILSALLSLNLNSTMILFAASLRKFHPEIAYEDAKNLIDWSSALRVAALIADVWNKSHTPAEEGKANPTQAAD
jgi:hypothetical protein